MASNLNERYNLVLVSYVYDKYKVEIINNPYEKIITSKWTINIQNDLIKK